MARANSSRKRPPVLGEKLAAEHDVAAVLGDVGRRLRRARRRRPLEMNLIAVDPLKPCMS